MRELTLELMDIVSLQREEIERLKELLDSSRAVADQRGVALQRIKEEILKFRNYKGNQADENAQGLLVLLEGSPK